MTTTPNDATGIAHPRVTCQGERRAPPALRRMPGRHAHLSAHHDIVMDRRDSPNALCHQPSHPAHVDSHRALPAADPEGRSSAVNPPAMVRRHAARMDPVKVVDTSPGKYILWLNAGSTDVDEVVEDLGHEPNGYFWAGIAELLVSTEAPDLNGRFEFDRRVTCSWHSAHTGWHSTISPAVWRR
ncbi:Imm51 family immunity protein [Actinoplanes sp. NPDC051343]|uniref:Imm51 family immunity protein n=1 Tax=Actinoplanes sp. NPDC051343 TaxID=3363906 RepID=UPI0037A9DA9E